MWAIRAPRCAQEQFFAVASASLPRCGGSSPARSVALVPTLMRHLWDLLCACAGGVREFRVCISVPQNSHQMKVNLLVKFAVSPALLGVVGRPCLELLDDDEREEWRAKLFPIDRNRWVVDLLPPGSVKVAVVPELGQWRQRNEKPFLVDFSTGRKKSLLPDSETTAYASTWHSMAGNQWWMCWGTTKCIICNLLAPRPNESCITTPHPSVPFSPGFPHYNRVVSSRYVPHHAVFITPIERNRVEFIEVDLRRTYRTKTLTPVSVSRCLIDPVGSTQHLEHVSPLYFKQEHRKSVFIVRVIFDCGRKRAVLKVTQGVGHASVLREEAEQLLQVSDSEFIISIFHLPPTFEVWDYNHTEAPLRIVQDSRTYSADSGFLVERSADLLKVSEASSGLVVLTLKVPSTFWYFMKVFSFPAL